MAHDDSFGASCGSRGVKNIGRTFGNRGDGKLTGYLMKALFGNIMFQGSRSCTGLMNGHIFHQEIYTLGGTEGDDPPPTPPRGRAESLPSGRFGGG